MHRQPEHAGNAFLRGAGALSGGVHQQAAIVPRDRQRRLSFQIQLFLPANFNATAGLPCAFGKGGIHIATTKATRFAKQRTRLLRLAWVERVRQRCQAQVQQAGGLARGVGIACHHQRQHLAGVTHFACGQQRLVGKHHADLVFTANVGGAQHRFHPRQHQRGAGINAVDAGMRQRRQHWRQV